MCVKTYPSDCALMLARTAVYATVVITGRPTASHSK